MSSGEVLFILAFIVLPTAVLVSSVWAVLFVRRRPNQVFDHDVGEAPVHDSVVRDEYEPTQSTALLATVTVLDEAPSTATRDTHPADDETQARDDDLAVEPADVAPVAAAEQVPEALQPDGNSEDFVVVQSTEDLNSVMAEVAANETVERASHPEPEPAPESLPDSHTTVFETTELPVLQLDEPDAVEPESALEPESKTVPVVEPVEEPEEVESDRQSGRSGGDGNARRSSARPTQTSHVLAVAAVSHSARCHSSAGLSAVARRARATPATAQKHPRTGQRPRVVRSRPARHHRRQWRRRC